MKEKKFFRGQKWGGGSSIFAMKKLFLVFLILTGCTQSQGPKKVGVCVVATGDYDVDALQLIETARTYFLKDHQVKYFVFTDNPLVQGEDVVIIPQKHLGRPQAALKRFHIYLESQDMLKDMDYLFAINATMRFVAPVGDEILGKTVAVMREKDSWEGKKRSKAFVKKQQAKQYFTGAFYGGDRKHFLSMVRKMKRGVDTDLKWGYIACCQDESYLNRYFCACPPQICLDRSYYDKGGEQQENDSKIVSTLKR